jgi:hypothetical protein
MEESLSGTFAIRTSDGRVSGREPVYQSKRRLLKDEWRDTPVLLAMNRPVLQRANDLTNRVAAWCTLTPAPALARAITLGDANRRSGESANGNL